jgi:hypothetical protein
VEDAALWILKHISVLQCLKSVAGQKIRNEIFKTSDPEDRCI